jgi:Mg2+ and Co2+ transporter CorA
VPPRDDEMARLLRDILDRLVSMETRLKNIEDLLRSRK